MVDAWVVQVQVLRKEREPDMNGIVEGQGPVRGSVAGKVVQGRRCRQRPVASWGSESLATASGWAESM